MGAESRNSSRTLFLTDPENVPWRRPQGRRPQDPIHRSGRYPRTACVRCARRGADSLKPIDPSGAKTIPSEVASMRYFGNGWWSPARGVELSVPDTGGCPNIAWCGRGLKGLSNIWRSCLPVADKVSFGSCSSGGWNVNVLVGGDAQDPPPAIIDGDISATWRSLVVPTRQKEGLAPTSHSQITAPVRIVRAVGAMTLFLGRRTGAVTLRACHRC